MSSKRTLVAVLLATLWATSSLSPASAETAAKPPAPAPATQAQIDRNGLLILLRNALSALDQANKTGNYTVLRDQAAPGFAAANNPARLGEIFAYLRRDKVDLSGALVMEPQLTVMPEITQNGMLHFAGFFPSASSRLNFEMLFAPVDGQWRLFGLGANLGSAAPAAPVPPPAPAPAPGAKKDEKKPPKP
ncbi:hypothetical protein [Methylocystis bryophila]|uniref:DUF4440 domain-containing protein n=1 Tax=Methylocystis bryophila TaxID=655015 RepID=A0A1W6MT97_9HYPH|nr:hypothetical protein [Methylocystis bryophila]ARN80785.1 hypothetical protein B1812_06525 [Methylocystis bryophila]BDV40869.1 hypothetical protein DSM21852_41220 [Methylocystis bryophila]